MHPSAVLIIWLLAVLTTQFAGYAGLGLLAALSLLLVPHAVSLWFAYQRRVFWLLLSLWLIFAYSMPGEAFNDLAWAPTYEGMSEASLHACRLLVILACLAALLAYLDRDKLVSGLWGLLRPLRCVGVEVDRLVVRLSLVLENFQSPADKVDWRSMLAADAVLPGGASVLHLQQLPWTLRDMAYSMLAAGFLLGAMFL